MTDKTEKPDEKRCGESENRCGNCWYHVRLRCHNVTSGRWGRVHAADKACERYVSLNEPGAP